MATRYYGTTGTAFTTCDVAGSTNRDLSTTIGGSGSAVGSASSASYVEIVTMDASMVGQGPVTGTHNASINITAIDTKCQGRFCVKEITSGTCAVANTSTYSAAFTTTGAKTLSASLTWGTPDANILRISCEIQRTSNSSSRSFTVAVGNASTYDDAPWIPPQTFSDTIASTSDGVTEAATYDRTLSDSVETSDSVSTELVVIIDRSFSDSVETSDSLSVETTYDRVLADSVDTSDTYEEAVTYDITLSDTVDATSDSVEVSQHYELTYSDSVETSDTYIASLDMGGTTYDQTYEDSVATDDSLFAEASHFETFSDTIEAADAVTTLGTVYDRGTWLIQEIVTTL